MRNSILVLITLILWESFLGFSHYIGYFDFFLIISAIIFVSENDFRKYLLWIIIVGLVVDLVRVDYLGTNIIINLGGVLLLFFINRVTKVFSGDSRRLLLLAYVVVGTLIKAFLSVFAGLELLYVVVLKGLVLNILIGLSIQKFVVKIDYKRIKV